MTSPRSPRRRTRASRPSSGHHGRPPHPRRRRRIGLWPVTVVLAAALVVLTTLLIVRDQRLDGGIDVAGADAITMPAGSDGRPADGGRDGASGGDADGSGADDAGAGADGAGAVGAGADGAGAVGAGAARAGRTDAEKADADRRQAARRRAAARKRAAEKRSAITPTVANGLLCAPAPNRPALVRRRAGGTSKRIALTFDDGPTKHTGPILDILRKADVPATFFVIGAQVGPNREIVRRIVRDGHALANHTWSHANVSGGGPAADSQLMDTQYAIQKAVGRAGCMMRPPGGAVGPGLTAWLRNHKKVGVMWDVDSNDYQLPSAAKMIRNVVSATRPGSIILFHDGGGDRSRTVAAVPTVISRLKAKGYEFVTVPELLKLPKAKT